MAKLSALSRLFLKISDSLLEEDVKNLRAVLGRESLGRAKVEHATPIEMFNMLEADNQIGEGNLRFLVQILRGLGKRRLADEAEQLEQEQRSEGRKVQDPEGVDKYAAKHRTLQPSSLSQVSSPGSSLESAGVTINTEGPAVESLPCSVTVTTKTADRYVAPQIQVTSPQQKITHVQTKKQTIRVSGVWEGVWRPQQSGKHSLGVCMGDMKSLISSVTVDVGSNNPVLRFGQKGRQQGQFDGPVDVAVHGDRLYVADTYNHRVQVFDLSGNFCHSFSTTTNPGSLAVQTDGTIVVNSVKEVKKFSPSGELMETKKFSLSEYCTNPYGLAVQRDGRVVIADPAKNSIFLFEADGTLVKQVGGQGEGEGQFNQPHFVCVDREDNIIVADKNNHCVQVFDRNMDFHHKFGREGDRPQDMWAPMGVSADSRGNIVLANMGGTTDGVGHGEKLQVFQSDGTWVSTISSEGDKLKWPHGVAMTEDGHVFVADVAGHFIRKYRYRETCPSSQLVKPAIWPLRPLFPQFPKFPP